MMLRLPCNENVPRALVVAPRDLGHDVRWVAEAMPGAADRDVLRAAADQRRLCVTFDKDFGELAARQPEAAAFGIILLQVPSWPADSVALRIATLIDARRDWAGQFSVTEPGRLRMRRIAETS